MTLTALTIASYLVYGCQTGCMMGNLLVSHLMYADDLVILSPYSAGCLEFVLVMVPSMIHYLTLKRVLRGFYNSGGSEAKFSNFLFSKPSMGCGEQSEIIRPILNQ